MSDDEPSASPRLAASIDLFSVRFLTGLSDRGELSVNAVAFLPSNPEHLVVCNRSPQIFVMSLSGAVVQTLASGKREGGDFVA